MAIDRNLRARLGAKLRADAKLTPTARLVGQAALFAGMDARTGRCQMYRAHIAKEAGCSERSVSRGTAALEEAGYIKVVPTYDKRKREVDGRWFRPRGPNVIEWVVPQYFFSAKPAALPSKNINKKANQGLNQPMNPALVAVLARFGNAIADRAGLPTVPS